VLFNLIVKPVSFLDTYTQYYELFCSIHTGNNLSIEQQYAFITDNGEDEMKLLQVDFEYHGPMGEEMSSALVELAESINREPGLMWKIWTENESEKLGGGIYLFEDEVSAKNYLEMHATRLKAMGVPEVRGIIFDVNQPLTAINQGPIER
jgi:hypothetical protein